jgi:hypothetical protein
MVPPVIAGTLLCSPLRQQMLQGQLNLYLLALLMGAWAAQRSRKPILSGSLVGIAAAIKLFPGFIILYLLTTRRFTAAAAAIIAAVSMTILSLVVLGTQAFRDYVGDVMPMVSTFTNIWANASVIGFWTKWFSAGVTNTVLSAGPPHIPPVSVLPGLAATGIAVSAMAICIVWAYKVYRLPPDQGFGITLVAMLLLSPVSWDHYFLLLILPIVQVWKGFPDNSLQRIVLIFVVVGMMLSPVVFVQAFGQSPSLLAVFGASIHFSALLALFLVMLSLARATTDEGAAFTS